MIIPLLIILVSVFPTPASLSADGVGTLSQSTDTIGAYVREYYADTPVLADIAWCESRMRQWNKNGTLFRGSVNHADVGVMQVNEFYQGKKAADLGINIYSLGGNLEYAQYLYNKEGTKPWSSSEACWDKIASK